MPETTGLERLRKGLNTRIANVSANYPVARALLEGGAVTAAGSLTLLHALDGVVAKQSQLNAAREAMKGLL
jgi:hypothetical protein